jgi:beta-glucosidase
MHGWLDQVPALLHNWYPGQEGGTAISEVVFGARSPEGHLPVSFEKSWQENPVHDSYYAPPVAKGQTPHVKYTEGVFLGYRYYTTMGKKPLFPFGYGMSYTTFQFSNLSVSPTTAGATVSFDLTNTGKRAGADVSQVYIGDPSAAVKRPERELKGYQKVRLKPGEMQHVQMTLDERAFSFWDETSNSWHVDQGPFKVFVGDSSVNTPLTTVYKPGK